MAKRKNLRKKQKNRFSWKKKNISTINSSTTTNSTAVLSVRNKFSTKYKIQNTKYQKQIYNNVTDDDQIAQLLG